MGESMTTVVLVDAVPGFEDAVASDLRDLEHVSKVVSLKRGNNDLGVLVDLDDPGEVQRFLINEIRTLSGLAGYEEVEDPSKELLSDLEV